MLDRYDDADDGVKTSVLDLDPLAGEDMSRFKRLQMGVDMSSQRGRRGTQSRRRVG